MDQSPKSYIFFIFKFTINIKTLIFLTYYTYTFLILKKKIYINNDK